MKDGYGNERDNRVTGSDGNVYIYVGTNTPYRKCRCNRDNPQDDWVFCPYCGDRLTRPPENKKQMLKG